jgi:hypothetical protein
MCKSASLYGVLREIHRADEQLVAGLGDRGSRVDDFLRASGSILLAGRCVRRG